MTLSQIKDYVIYTDHYPYNANQYLLKLIEEAGELGEDLLLDKRMVGDRIKDTVEEELWDVLYYLVHVSLATQVDLPEAMVLREKNNEQRFGRAGLAEFFKGKETKPQNLMLHEIQAYASWVSHPELDAKGDYIHLVKELGAACQAYTRSTEHKNGSYRLASAGKIDGTLEARLWDALFYLLRIANDVGANLEQCAVIKEKHNAQRFGRMGIDAFISDRDSAKGRSSQDAL